MGKACVVYEGHFDGKPRYGPLTLVDAKALDPAPEVIECNIPTKKKQRTILQNAAMHKYFTMLAEALNAGGYSFSFEGVRGMTIELDYTDMIVKEFVWKLIQLPMTGIARTRDLEPKHVGMIYDELNRYMINEKDIDCPFPSIDQLRRDSQ